MEVPVNATGGAMTDTTHYQALKNATPEDVTADTTAKQDGTENTTVPNPDTAGDPLTDNGTETGATGNIEYLNDHGPTPVTSVTLDDNSELPGLPHNINLTDRRLGVCKFNVSKTTQAGGMNVNATPIAYLVDPETLSPLPGHEPAVVLRRWLQANPKVVENVNRKTLAQKIGSHGSQFRDVQKHVLDEFYSDHSGWPTHPKYRPSN